MKLKLQRPLIFFDLETTGVNVASDRIVEISMIKIHPNGMEDTRTIRINPECHIPEASTAVHGITDEDVKDCPTFKDVASDIFAFFEGCDVGGFNSNKLDVPMLIEEFQRCKLEFDTMNREFIDVQNIFHKMEKRTLVAAYKFYCGKDLVNAHSAQADTRATLEVIEAQLDRYPDDLQNDVHFLAEFSRLNNNIDFDGRFVYNEQGEEVVNFGKHKGRKLREVLMQEPGYYNWIQRGEFSRNTKQVLTRIWLNMKYQSKKN
ncbi:MAG: 3'-5' exonuclease [Bacteroidaceae bacterium]|jgi:DNA polymerase-3 subunit epsilon|nr:3'-5' exonuclease [Bacteroidaceae bacterium]